MILRELMLLGLEHVEKEMEGHMESSEQSA
jgi:hypothetical protein